MNWMITELEEIEEELVREELARELEELGYVGCADYIEHPDWMDALNMEFTMANTLLVDNLLY